MASSAATDFTLQQVLSILPAKQDGKYICPVCAERHLTVSEKRGKVVVYCFSPDCSSGAAWKAITETLAKLKPPKDARPKGPGLTLSQYAVAKGLNADWLSSFFLLSEATHQGAPAVAFPYGMSSMYRTDRDTIVWDFERSPDVKWRTGMGARDRSWQKGAKSSLYGQGQLAYVDRQRKQDGEPPRDYCFLVEGESDTQTLMYNNFAALGVSGVETWREEDAQNTLLVGKDIYVIQEPGQPGEKFVEKVAASFPVGKVHAAKLRAKDPSELWILTLTEAPFELEAQAQFKDEIEKVMAAAGVVPFGLPAFRIVPCTAIALKKIEWLWTDRIPRNKLTLFYGLPDTGKSAVAIDIIARLTRGAEMPDRPAVMAASDVLVLSSEDDRDDTYKPRLVAAGAECSRIEFIEATSLPGKKTQIERHTAFDKDMCILEQTLRDRPDVRLVVLDPITSYLGDLNRNKDSEVRPLLEKFKELARRFKVTVLGITFFNKNSEQAGIHRLSGAGAWAEVPRSLWAFVKAPKEKLGGETPESETRDHLMLNAKLNITEPSKRQGLRYGFKGVPVRIEDADDQIVAINWLGNTNITLETVMKEDRRPSGPKPVSTDAAIQWLENFIGAEEKLASEVIAEGKAAGHAYETLQEAKRRLGVESRRPLKNKGSWQWRLPKPPPALDPQ